MRPIVVNLRYERFFKDFQKQLAKTNKAVIEISLRLKMLEGGKLCPKEIRLKRSLKRYKRR